MSKIAYQLILIGFLLGNILFASKEEIKADILVLNNRLGEVYLSDLVDNIYENSLKYNINHKIVIAIFRMESNFDIGAVNYASNDYGIGQINKINIKHYKLNLGLLLTELNYAVESTYIHLNNLKKSYNTGSKGYFQWFTRYHSFTPKFRKIYYLKLKVFLQKVRYTNE